MSADTSVAVTEREVVSATSARVSRAHPVHRWTSRRCTGWSARASVRHAWRRGDAPGLSRKGDDALTSVSADALFSAGVSQAALGASRRERWFAGAGVVAVLASGAFGSSLSEVSGACAWTSVGPARASVTGAHHTVAAQVTAAGSGDSVTAPAIVVCWSPPRSARRSPRESRPRSRARVVGTGADVPCGPRGLRAWSRRSGAPARSSVSALGRRVGPDAVSQAYRRRAGVPAGAGVRRWRARLVTWRCGWIRQCAAVVGAGTRRGCWRTAGAHRPRGVRLSTAWRGPDAEDAIIRRATSGVTCWR